MSCFRYWSNATIEAMLIRCCAECPDHHRLCKRTRKPDGCWITEYTCAKCRRTGRHILQLTGIADHCPLPTHPKILKP